MVEHFDFFWFVVEIGMMVEICRKRALPIV